MYAVIKTGGKQRKVRVGDSLDIEKLETGVGEEITFEDFYNIMTKKTFWFKINWKIVILILLQNSKPIKNNYYLN